MFKKEDFKDPLYRFVKRGKRRKAVLKTLNTEFPKTPTEIAKEQKCCFNASDRALKELERKGLVECLNPEDKIGKLHVLTEAGKRIKDMIFGSEQS